MKIEHRVAILAVFIATQCGAAELSLQRAAGEAAGTFGDVLNVSVASTANVPSSLLTGIQFDLAYDTTSLEVTAKIGQAAENAGKTITTVPLGTRGLRVIIIGFNQNTLTDGPVAVIHISPKRGTAAGARIRLTAPMGTTREGMPLAIALREPEQAVR